MPPLMHFRDRPVRNAIRARSGAWRTPLAGSPGNLYAAGIAQIDVASVVSAQPVKRYAVLPSRAGLAVLVDAGALTVAGTSRGVRINGGDFKPFTSANKFIILEKIRLPAGATGTFILPRDMLPKLEGDLSQVCIISEADMKPLTGERRGRSFRVARRLPQAELR